MAKCAAIVKKSPEDEEGKVCGKKTVKTYMNSASKDKKSFCEDHGPWLLPYSEGTWGKVDD